MSGSTSRRHWLLMAVAAVLAFGAVMFIAGRATAPTATTDSTDAVVRSEDETTTQTDATTASDTRANSQGDDQSGTENAAATDTAAPDTANNAAAEELPPGCEALDDFPTVALSELPEQAYDTIGVIADGPPYPYRADGGVFQNREGILPDRERGYYHEFTVETPGSSDRGARRIVTGDCGEFFYTADHYDSFELIDLER